MNYFFFIIQHTPYPEMEEKEIKMVKRGKFEGEKNLKMGKNVVSFQNVCQFFYLLPPPPLLVLPSLKNNPLVRELNYLGRSQLYLNPWTGRLLR